MTGPDAVFGPPLTCGGYACPDCHAPADRQCYDTCPRYVEDPGDDEKVPDGR